MRFGIKFRVKFRLLLPKIYPMATFYKVGGVWRAQVARRGIRKSQSGFQTKAAAVAWAGRVESEIMSGVRGETSSLLFRDIIDRYAKERSP